MSSDLNKISLKKNVAFVIVLLSMLVACEKSDKKISIEPIKFSELPNWDADKLIEVWPAFLRSCAHIKNSQSDTVFENGQKILDWQQACSLAIKVDSSERSIRDFFETYFVPYKIEENNNVEGLFTGYYEPEIQGSKTKKGQYTVPVYKNPTDLISIKDLGIFKEELKDKMIVGKVVNDQLIPYLTRSEIEKKGLTGDELVWVNDAIDNFFMHIQGMGFIHLDSGEKIRIFYSGTNGRRYRAIGKILVERKELMPENVSMQSIKTWLKSHPESAKEIMDQNESFTFFRILKEQGPIGEQGVVLTPNRSLGVNSKYIAYGTPILLDIPFPLSNNTRIQKLVIAQDEDYTVKGAIGGDLFCGTGFEAGECAGQMKSIGTYFLLLPKTMNVKDIQKGYCNLMQD